MSNPSGPRHKNLFLAVAAVLAIWGILGVLDVPKQPSSGYSSNNNIVTDIDAGSPAEAAGLQVGDSLVTIAGVAMGPAQNNVRRAEIGQARTFVVHRDGRDTTMELTYGPQSGGDAFGGYFGILMGVLFLFMGLWAYFKAPHAGTRLLAILGCLVGPIMLSGPYIAPGLFIDIFLAVAISGMVIGPAVALDFVLRSGRQNGYEQDGGGPRWLYWPAILIALMLVVLNLLNPDIQGLAGTILTIVFGAFLLTYFAGPLFLVVRNYMKADTGLRTSRGLGLMLAGAIIGLAPLTLLFLLSLLPGNINLPGLNYAAFGIVAVPITFALAAVRWSGAAAAPEAADGAPPAM